MNHLGDYVSAPGMKYLYSQANPSNAENEMILYAWWSSYLYEL